MGAFASKCGGELGCPFFDQEAVSGVSKERGLGLCRLSLPQAKDPHWPTVNANDWCGSHPNIAMHVQRVMQREQMEEMMKMQQPASGLVVPTDMPPELLRP